MVEFLLGIHPHAVRKRTPRVAVKKSEADDNDDEHVAALTLTGALQGGGSPHVSQTPYRRAERRRPSPVQSNDRMVYNL